MDLLKNNEIEVFAKIPINQHYEVSNFGRVRSFKRRKMKYLKPCPRGHSGYICVRLQFDDGHHKDYSIHNLVAMTFIPNPNNKPYVNHKDGNKKNNHIDNLEWVTASENTLHWYHELGAIENRGKRIYMYSKNGNYIREYRNAKFAGTELNIDPSSIIACAHGQRKSAGEFLWSFEKKEKIDAFVDSKLIPICEFNKYGELVACFDSISSASRMYNLNTANITGVCKKRRGFNEVFGRVFRYKNDRDVELFLQYQNKEIQSFTRANTPIAKYYGLKNAVISTGCSFYKIIKCCEGESISTNGYKFIVEK